MTTKGVVDDAKGIDDSSAIPPVRMAVMAWLNMWNAMTSTLNGHSTLRTYGTFHRVAMLTRDVLSPHLAVRLSGHYPSHSQGD
jgi:hypothetical protein